MPGQALHVLVRHHHAIVGHRHTGLDEERLLDHPVLRRSHRTRRRRHPRQRSQPLQRRRRHVLELGGHGLAQLAQLLQRGLVQIGGADVAIGHPGGNAVQLGIEHTHPVAQPLRGLAEHPAQLAAPQHTQPAARRQGLPARLRRRHGLFGLVEKPLEGRPAAPFLFSVHQKFLYPRHPPVSAPAMGKDDPYTEHQRQRRAHPGPPVRACPLQGRTRAAPNQGSSICRAALVWLRR